MVAAELRVVAGLGLTAVEMSSAGAPGNSLSSRPGPDPTEENYQVVWLLSCGENEENQMTKVTTIFDMNTITNIPWADISKKYLDSTIINLMSLVDLAGSQDVELLMMSDQAGSPCLYC